MSDIDKWRQRALRLEALLDESGKLSKPASESDISEIKTALGLAPKGSGNVRAQVAARLGSR